MPNYNKNHPIHKKFPNRYNRPEKDKYTLVLNRNIDKTLQNIKNNDIFVILINNFL